MSNPVIPIVPVVGAGLVDNEVTDDDTKVQRDNNELDEGETADSQDTVEEDVREGDDVNDNIEK